MNKTETLHIRVNENVKKNAEETLETLGMTLSEAVNIFLCQVGLTGGLPFEVKLPPPPERVVFHNAEELRQKLAEAEKSIAEGRVYTEEEVFGMLEEKYGIRT